MEYSKEFVTAVVLGKDLVPRRVTASSRSQPGCSPSSRPPWAPGLPHSDACLPEDKGRQSPFRALRCPSLEDPPCLASPSLARPSAHPGTLTAWPSCSRAGMCLSRCPRCPRCPSPCASPGLWPGLADAPSFLSQDRPVAAGGFPQAAPGRPAAEHQAQSEPPPCLGPGSGHLVCRVCAACAPTHSTAARPRVARLGCGWCQGTSGHQSSPPPALVHVGKQATSGQGACFCSHNK